MVATLKDWRQQTEKQKSKVAYEAKENPPYPRRYAPCLDMLCSNSSKCTLGLRPKESLCYCCIK